jgi:hypothetical protein
MRLLPASGALQHIVADLAEKLADLKVRLLDMFD